MTLPKGGRGGDWIVKLPDNRYERVPENEFSMMTWAKAAGADVPAFELVKVAELEGLPTGLGLKEPYAFAIKRFDRPLPGRRVHIEDFAQILGVRPREKYDIGNYETIARILLAIDGVEAIREFIRRLVLIIASGNADAHLKNWSIIYPDDIHPKLSPAYDMVSTIQYIANDQLALNLARSKRFEDVSMESFRRMARKLNIEEAEVVAIVGEARMAVLEAWSDIKGDLPLSATDKARIETHWRRVPLLQQV